MEEAQSSRQQGEACAQDSESSGGGMGLGFSLRLPAPGSLKSHIFITAPHGVHTSETRHSHTFANQSGF